MSSNPRPRPRLIPVGLPGPATPVPPNTLPHLPKLAAVGTLGSVSRVGTRLRARTQHTRQGVRAEPCTDSQLELEITGTGTGRAVQRKRPVYELGLGQALKAKSRAQSRSIQSCCGGLGQSAVSRSGANAGQPPLATLVTAGGQPAAISDYFCLISA
jgi:hypothetical protein